MKYLEAKNQTRISHFMKEILEIKQLLLRGNTAAALLLVEELEEISRDDKFANIYSYAVVLLYHLVIKQVEQQTTKSREVSIRNCVRVIQEKNKRRKIKGYYLSQDDLYEVLESAYESAIDTASLEVEEGRYESKELNQKVNKDSILDDAIYLLNKEEGNG